MQCSFLIPLRPQVVHAANAGAGEGGVDCSAASLPRVGRTDRSIAFYTLLLLSNRHGGGYLPGSDQTTGPQALQEVSDKVTRAVDMERGGYRGDISPPLVKN